jgi:hypothetical protein
MTAGWLKLKAQTSKLAEKTKPAWVRLKPRRLFTMDVGFWAQSRFFDN